MLLRGLKSSKSKRFNYFISFFLLYWIHATGYGQINDIRNVHQQWKTDTTEALVTLNEFTALLKRDAIQPVDSPEFWNAEKAEEFYFENEPVSVVVLNGEARAYPQSILMYHEIVNDRVGGFPVAVTYCPLCNSAIVYSRKVETKNGLKILDFGTSGMLRKSNLVMWDRQTESWWQQFTGEALAGSLAGNQLTWIPAEILTVHDFFNRWPEGKILAVGNYGSNDRYGINPYVHYDAIENVQPRLFREKPDPRLPAMERVVHVTDGRINKIYPLSVIGKSGLIQDTVGSRHIVLFYQPGAVSVLDDADIRKGRNIGTVTVFDAEYQGSVLSFHKKGTLFEDKQTGSVWDITGKCIAGPEKGKSLTPVYYGVHFAFAWFAFFPDAEIYREK